MAETTVMRIINTRTIGAVAAVLATSLMPSNAVAHQRATFHHRHRHTNRHSALIAAAPTTGGSTSAGTGTTYYVAPTGSDSNSGTSPVHPWRTVTKVNRASVGMHPGDTVLFRGGVSFSDSALMPGWGSPIYGTSSDPITFGAYGGGRAILPQGIWFPGGAYLTFDELSLGPDAGLQGGSDGQSTASHITVERCRVDFGPSASNSDRPGIAQFGNDWTIQGNVIDHIGNSGMLLLGDTDIVSYNTIRNTGLNPTITYGMHGIYLKVSNAVVTHNTITNFSADGISVRYRNNVVSDNFISRGAIGIAWFQYDTTTGTSDWTNNHITHTSAGGFYVSPSDRAGQTIENFVITGNTIAAPTPGPRGNWVPMNLHSTTGTYTVQSNTVPN